MVPKDTTVKRSMTIHVRPMLMAFELAVAVIIATPAWANSTPIAATDTAVIAGRISDALSHTEVLPRELLADKIEVRHIPAMPSDPEVIDKEDFGKQDRAALKSAMKDFRMDVISTVPEVNAFTIILVLTGMPSSGDGYSSRISLRFIVANGVVTGLEATQNPAERAMLEKIEEEGGYRARPRN
jgi:hypothetical protein